MKNNQSHPPRFNLLSRLSSNEKQKFNCVAFFLLLFILIFFLGSYLQPFLLALFFACTIKPLVNKLYKINWPQWLVLTTAMLLLFAVVTGLFFLIIPILLEQVKQLITRFPESLQQSQEWVNHLAQKLPWFSHFDLFDRLSDLVKKNQSHLVDNIANLSVSTVSSIVAVLTYFVITPILFLYFIKDEKKLFTWGKQFLPQESKMIKRVLTAFSKKMDLFIRGHVIETVVVSALFSVLFFCFDLNYAFLLASIVGVSTWIPYVGALIASVPVILVAAMEWGGSFHFLLFSVCYLVLLAVEGNVLGPYIMSKATQLHPVAVIFFLSVFGGLFGFWGVVFAVPTAMLFNIIIKTWRKA